MFGPPPSRTASRQFVVTLRVATADRGGLSIPIGGCQDRSTSTESSQSTVSNAIDMQQLLPSL